MKALIARLEAVTEGSRELDAVIRKAIGIRATNEDKLTPEQIESHHRTFAPAYTTSIDAALTLVPDGMEYEISTMYGIARVEVGLNASNDGAPWSGERKDVNVPIALCIAALRARQP